MQRPPGFDRESGGFRLCKDPRPIMVSGNHVTIIGKKKISPIVNISMTTNHWAPRKTSERETCRDQYRQ